MAVLHRSRQKRAAAPRDCAPALQMEAREILEDRQPHREMGGPVYEVLMATIAACSTSRCSMETLTSLLSRPAAAVGVKGGRADQADLLREVGREERADRAIDAIVLFALEQEAGAGSEERV